MESSVTLEPTQVLLTTSECYLAITKAQIAAFTWKSPKRNFKIHYLVVTNFTSLALSFLRCKMAISALKGLLPY